MSYKNLLQRNNHATEIPAFGQKVWVRRLSGGELDAYSDAVAAERAGDNNDAKLNLMAVSLFLSALVNKDGTKPAAKDLPDPAELLKAQPPGDLFELVVDIQRHSYGTLEAATKN